MKTQIMIRIYTLYLQIEELTSNHPEICKEFQKKKKLQQ